MEFIRKIWFFVAGIILIFLFFDKCLPASYDSYEDCGVDMECWDQSMKLFYDEMYEDLKDGKDDTYSGWPMRERAIEYELDRFSSSEDRLKVIKMMEKYSSECLNKLIKVDKKHQQ